MIYNCLRYFGESEFSYPERMDEDFLRTLDTVRHYAGIPLVITSSYREGDPGAHGQGKAVDIRANTGANRFLIVQAALRAGITRIGVYNKHIHLDTGERLPEHVLWVGTSR